MSQTDAQSSTEAGPSHLQRARRSLVKLLNRVRRPITRQSLRTTLAILKAQQEATIDGILVVDANGHILSYNRRFLEIWHIPEPVATVADDNELLGYAAELVEDWDSFIEEVNYLYAHPDQVRTDDVVALKDGRVLTRASVPVKSEGKYAGRAWYFRDVTEAKRIEKLQSALFRIAQLSRESEDLDHFYAAIHDVIGELMDATNFYIAEVDFARGMLRFPYFVDQFDPQPDEIPIGHGLTAYVIRTGKSLLTTPEAFSDLIARGEVASVGAPSVDWVGVPLRTGDTTWGVIGVQSYDESVRFSQRDLEILEFVAEHVASAIEQKRKDDAVRSSERRYRQMFENNRAVQLVIDPVTGAIVDANMAACDFYGYTPDELRSMRVWDINVLGEQGVRDEMENAARQQRSYFIFRHMRANGEVRDVEVHSGPIDVGDRKLLYSIIHDITERKRAEQAVLESEEKYRNIFDFASIGIYQATPEGRFITANRTLAVMLGYDSVEEMLVQAPAYDIDLSVEDRPHNYEVEWKRKDGSPIWVQINAHALHSSKGALYFEGFVDDVTERKLAEERLATSNAQRIAVLDAATRASIIATDSDGTITVFNTGAERLLGYTAEEMIGKRRLTDLHVVSELAEHLAGLQREFDGPIGDFDILATRAAIFGLEEREWTYVKKNGESLTVHVAVTAIRADDGSITGFLHVGTDVSARKHAEEMLRKQLAAMQASMDGIGILDHRLDFTYANDALARLFGFSDARDVVGKNLCDLYEPPEQVRFVTIIMPQVLQRGRWRGEASGHRRDGAQFPQEISLTSLDGGGFVCVVRDITERTYAEEQIKHLAYHDALTGLPNRLLFKDRETVALSHAQRDNSRLLSRCACDSA